ncbi:MAG: NOP5/NOP56 family protein [Methanobacteriota archaeon]
MLLVTEWFGALLVDGDKVRERALFPKDGAEIARRLRALEKGEILPEERSLATSSVEVVEERLLGLSGARLVARAPSFFGESKEFGFDESLYRDAVFALGRMKVRESAGRSDLHVVQAVEAMDDVVHAGNLLTERLREWYSLHFPEILNLVGRQEEFAALVAEHGSREAILKQLGFTGADEALGAPLSERDERALRAFAASIEALFAERRRLDAQVETVMREIAPNLSAVVGAHLAGKLVRHAGGLAELAASAAGTVQTLGAEKALFRHLAEGNRPPKHGALFLHPLVHRAPWWQRGRVARALASAAVQAARADVYTKATIHPLLKQRLERRVAEIQAKKSKPPARRPAEGKKPAPRGPGRGGRDRR